MLPLLLLNEAAPAMGVTALPLDDSCLLAPADSPQKDKRPEELSSRDVEVYSNGMGSCKQIG